MLKLCSHSRMHCAIAVNWLINSSYSRQTASSIRQGRSRIPEKTNDRRCQLTSYRWMTSRGVRDLMASMDMKWLPLKGMLRHKSSLKKRMLPSAMSSSVMPSGKASEPAEADAGSCALGVDGAWRSIASCRQHTKWNWGDCCP